MITKIDFYAYIYTKSMIAILFTYLCIQFGGDVRRGRKQLGFDLRLLCYCLFIIITAPICFVYGFCIRIKISSYSESRRIEDLLDNLRDPETTDCAEVFRNVYAYKLAFCEPDCDLEEDIRKRLLEACCKYVFPYKLSPVTCYYLTKPSQRDEFFKRVHSDVRGYHHFSYMLDHINSKDNMAFLYDCFLTVLPQLRKWSMIQNYTALRVLPFRKFIDLMIINCIEDDWTADSLLCEEIKIANSSFKDEFTLDANVILKQERALWWSCYVALALECPYPVYNAIAR